VYKFANGIPDQKGGTQQQKAGLLQTIDTFCLFTLCLLYIKKKKK
jgi:hypothetical protein